MKRDTRNIVLVGFMATGKSSVGRNLADRLGYDFFDVDILIEQEAGMSISQIFAAQGEPAFRALETAMVERVAGLNRNVVATGGGAILNPRNLELLKRNGLLITLAASPETILARVGPGDDRPMLHGNDKLGKIRALLDERAPAYAQADLTVDVSTKSVDEVALCITDLLERGMP